MYSIDRYVIPVCVNIICHILLDAWIIDYFLLEQKQLDTVGFEHKGLPFSLKLLTAFEIATHDILDSSTTTQLLRVPPTGV